MKGPVAFLFPTLLMSLFGPKLVCSELISAIRQEDTSGNSVVTVRAIVVGDYQNGDDDELRNLGGFFLQEEKQDEDGNATTSEGIFVYEGRADTRADVELGNTVEVTGRLTLFKGTYQIMADDIAVVDDSACTGKGSEVDECLSRLVNFAVVPSLAGADLNHVEGMIVVFPENMMISNQFQLERFNEVDLFVGHTLPYQFTQLSSPSQIESEKYANDIKARTIKYDDGLSSSNVGVKLDGFGTDYNEENALRVGDSIRYLRGNLQLASGSFRVRSYRDNLNSFDAASNPYPREYEPPLVHGNLKIASVNVLNFFKTLDRGNIKTKTGQDPRGADSADEFNRQLFKLVNAIVAMDADIVGILEMENEFDNVQDKSTAIEVLVDALNGELNNILSITSWAKPLFETNAQLGFFC